MPSNKGIVMTVMNKIMIDDIDQKIGNKSFYSVRELVSAGVFGSLSSARRALQGGRLTYIRISQRRFVVQRQELLNFLQKSFGGNKEGF
jgi:hypothetical protein